MRIPKLCLTAVLMVAAASLHATPVEYDGDGYHLVVCRPFDSWSGDMKVMEGELETIAKHRARVAFRVSPSSSAIHGAGLAVFNGTTADDPLVRDTVALIEARGFTLTQSQRYHWTLGLPTELDPSDYPRLRAVQSAAYAATVRKQGDPDTLPGSIRGRRIFGELLALGTVGAGTNLFGGVGAYVATTALADDISRLPLEARRALAPYELPELDTSKFAKVEVYPVTVNEGGSPGQVIVAYTAVPTQEVRHAALVVGLASLAGTDSTPAAVEAARAQDLQFRKTLWNECVRTQQCASNDVAKEGDPR